MQQQGFKAEIHIFLILLVILTILGWHSGYLTTLYLIGCASYIAWIFYRTQKLSRWLNAGMRTPPEYIPGIAGSIAEQCYYLHTRNERAKEIQRTQIDRINSLTNALTEGVITLRSNLTLSWWNPSAAQLLHLRDGDQGSPIHNLLRSPRFVAFIQQQSFEQVLEMPSPSNPLQTIQFNGAIFGNGSIVLVVRDVTRLRQLEQIRKDFIANISHELRTPLTVMTGYIETLQDTVADDQPGWQKALSQMSSQANRMTHLADDLLTLTKLESTENPPPKKPSSIAAAIEPDTPGWRSIVQWQPPTVT